MTRWRLVVGGALFLALAASPAPAEDRGVVALPFVFSSPETGVAVSGMAMYFSRKELDTGHAGTDIVSVSGLYTQESQYMAAVSASAFPGGGRWRISNQLSVQEFPTDYYGIGNTTLEAAEESYTPEQRANELTLQRWLGGRWYLGLRWDARRIHILEAEEGGAVEAYYQERGLKLQEERLHGVGVVLTRDSRNAPFFPTMGSQTTLRAMTYPERFGSQATFQRYGADHRRYLRLGQRGALALQVQGQRATTDAPLPLQPKLGGGATMRGFYQGRYVDELYLSTQIEARLHLRGRWQGVIFAAAGDVFPGMSEVTGEHLKYGAGAGIRYALQQRHRLNLRLDAARGYARGEAEETDTVAVYFNFTEAF